MPDFDSQWVNIPDERMARFQKMFQWSDDTSHYYDGAHLEDGLDVVDFGCGPGHQAVEFARRIGPGGHVHALDINPDFLSSVRNNVEKAGLGGRVTTHLLHDHIIPLPDASVDRAIVRNTLIHVPDPAAIIAEFHRVLRPGGLAHMIEGDRFLMAVEPIGVRDWNEIIEAARWAWKQPTIGRRLYGLARQCGFSDVEVQVVTAPDTTGRLSGMIRTIGDYAVEGGMAPERVSKIMAVLDRAISGGDYLAVSPQFIVTASR